MYTKNEKYDFDRNENVEMSPLPMTPRNTKNSTRMRRGKNLIHAIQAMYYDYCGNTSIHGIQYLGENRPFKEKFFWSWVFLISIYCCSNLINSVYVKWTETPVIVSFSEKSTPVWSIPFPAVTICSETKRIKKKDGLSFSVLRKASIDSSTFPNNLTDIEFDEFRTLLQICNPQVIDENLPRLSPKEIEYCDILDEMLPPFERYFYYCKWFSHFGECDDLFMKTYTEEGICYTFNGLTAMELYREDTYQYQRMEQQREQQRRSIISNRTLTWSLEDGYTEESGLRTYPARVLAAGARAGLFIVLQSFRQEIDYGCRGPVQGYKVLLHSPDDVPHVSKDFVRIPIGKEIIVGVKPNMITTSSGIASYHAHRRQCFLSWERSLRYFRTYTQSNCELECLANFTLTKCGCVKFSMPRTMDTPVCAEDKIHCFDKAEDDVMIREFTEGLKCDCLPACTSLVYNTEISQGNFDLEEMLAADDDTTFMTDNPGAQMSRLSIYFKENQFITSKRSELYGITDFLANCGGIFGLFMGFSILSLVEVIYHFSLRLWTNVKNMAKN